MARLRAILSTCVVATSLAGCGGDSAQERVGRTAETLLNVDEFLYFRCNSTSWGVDDSTRLKPSALSNVGTLTFQVTQPWIVSGSDQCILTRTNQLNGWGSVQESFSDPTPSTPLLVPGGAALLSSPSNFAVHYPALGTYTIKVDWTQHSFTISTGNDDGGGGGAGAGGAGAGGAGGTANCSDGVRDGNETDIDCGGSCLDCGNGLACSVNGDCQSGQCLNGTCAGPQVSLPFWLSYCSEPTCGGAPLVVKVCPETNPGCTPTRATTIVPQLDGRQINQILFPVQHPEGSILSLVSGSGTVSGDQVLSFSSPIVLRSDFDVTLSFYEVPPVWGGTTRLGFTSQVLSSPEVVTTVYRHPSFLLNGEATEFQARGRTIITQESAIAGIQPGQMHAIFMPTEFATFGEGNFSDGNLNIFMNYSNPPFIAASGGIFNVTMPRFAHEYVHELFSEIAQNYPGNHTCLNEGLADAFAFAAGFLPEADFGPIGLRGADFDQGCAQLVNHFEEHDFGNCPLWQVRRLASLSQNFAATMLHPQHVIDFDSCDLTSSRTGNALLVLFSESAGQDLTQAIQMAQIPNAGSLAAAKQALGLP